MNKSEEMPIVPHPFRWCLSSLGCSEYSFAKMFGLAKRFGVQELELCALENRLDLPAYFAEIFGEPARLKTILEESAVRITVLDTSFRLVGDDGADKEELLAWVPWAEALQVPYLRVLPS